MEFHSAPVDFSPNFDVQPFRIGWQDSWINDDGSYKLRLADGDYELLYVETFSETVSFNLPFSIQEGIAIVNGEEVSTLDLELQEGTVVP